MRIIMNSSALVNVLNQAPDVAHLFDGTRSFMLCSPTSAPPSVSVNIIPVGNYQSFEKAQSDHQGGKIHPAFGYLMYDNEKWSLTPIDEYSYPRRYMQRFGQWAHVRGYQVINVPARDLAFGDKEFPRIGNEKADTWYMRTNIATAAARWGDVYSIQSQADEDDDFGGETDTTAFETLVADSVQKAKTLNGNPYGSRFCGLSTSRGTSGQMLGAWNTVSDIVGGFWLNVPNQDFASAITFLRSL